MNEIFQYFADVLLVTMRDALILLLDTFLKIKPKSKYIYLLFDKTWLFIGSRNSLHTTEIARANEQPSFIFKNVSSSRMRASRIVTSKTSAKY